jgi:hypothetical protein
MRKLSWFDISDVDTQQCLIAFNERADELGIKEEDIISVQRVWNDDPHRIILGNGKEEDANVTLYIFYWKPEKRQKRS